MRRRIAVALLAAASLALARTALRARERARGLAVTEAEGAPAGAPTAPLLDLPEAGPEGAGAPAPGLAGSPVAGLAGGERSVNALAERDGLVFAATQDGLVVLDGERRAATLLEGEGVAALAPAGASLFAATERGIFRVSVDGGAEPLAASGPAGEPLRPTALAAGGTSLWVGTASGVYSIPLAVAEAPLLSRTARSHPLASGDPRGETGAVASLAPLEGGAVAGTDDGGLVRIGADGGAAGARFEDPRANEASPGASAPAGEGAVAIGTRGGLLVAWPRGMGLEVGRPRGLERAEISAVSAGRAGLLVGTADGAVLRLRRPGPGTG